MVKNKDEDGDSLQTDNSLMAVYSIRSTAMVRAAGNVGSSEIVKKNRHHGM